MRVSAFVKISQVYLFYFLYLQGHYTKHLLQLFTSIKSLEHIKRTILRLVGHGCLAKQRRLDHFMHSL